MSEQEKHWQQALEALVTGQPIDWDGMSATKQDLGALRHLEHIQVAMKENLHNHIEDVPDSYLFQWGHLYALKSIGSGGFGDVYQCHDAALSRMVALKLLNEERIRSWQKNQFIEEARNMARIRSPHVLTIHGAAMHQGQVGFWCDYIQGQTLNQVDVSHDWSEAMRMMTSLSLALKSVHEGQLVHGDIKPANVMLSEQGRYVLMDFGGSLLGGEAEWAAANWVGSPEYMAPELFADQGKSTASDVYALGLLFLQQVTSETPFKAKDWEQLTQQKKQVLRWPISANHIPKHWQQLILSMCHPDPQQRPDASEVVDAINDLKNRPERLRNRNRRWALMGLMLVGSLLSWWATWQIQNTKTQLETEQGITEQVNQFLSDLLNAGSAMGQGREVRMVDVIDAAALQIDVTLADSPSSRAQLHQAVGNSYNSLRLLDKAQPHLKQSLQLFQQTAGEQATATINAQLELAFNLMLLGEHEDSARFIEEAINRSAADPEQQSVHVLALIRKARLLVELGENQAAVILLEPWLNLTEAPVNTDNNLPTMLLTVLSDAHYNLGEYKQALSLAELALELHQLRPQDQGTRTIGIHTQIAKAAQRLGNIDLALTYFEQLVNDAVQFYGEGNPTHISALVNYGAILSNTDRPEAAFTIKQQAYELANEHLGSAHRTTIQAGMNYANALNKSMHADQARELMEALLPKSKESFGETHQTHLMLVYNLVELLNQQQAFEQAWPMAQNNAESATQKLGRDHPLTLYILTNLATSEAGLGRFEKAWQLFDEVNQTNGEDPPKIQDLYEVTQRLQQQVSNWQSK